MASAILSCVRIADERDAAVSSIARVCQHCGEPVWVSEANAEGLLSQPNPPAIMCTVCVAAMQAKPAGDGHEQELEAEPEEATDDE